MFPKIRKYQNNNEIQYNIRQMPNFQNLKGKISLTGKKCLNILLQCYPIPDPIFTQCSFYRTVSAQFIHVDLNTRRVQRRHRKVSANAYNVSVQLDNHEIIPRLNPYCVNNGYGLNESFRFIYIDLSAIWTWEHGTNQKL